MQLPKWMQQESNPTSTASMAPIRIPDYEEAQETTQPLSGNTPNSTSQPARSGSRNAATQRAAPLKRSLSAAATAAQQQLWSSGTLCVLLAALVFSVSALLVKLTGNRVPVLQITLVRSAASWVVGVGLCWYRGTRPMFGHRERLGWLCLRGLTGASAMTSYYVSLLLLPMGDAVTLFFLNPSLTAVLVWLVRGEQLSWLGASGCASSFLGLLLVVHPPFLWGGHQDWGPNRQLGVLAGVASSICCAGAFLCIRMIGKEEPALVVALWFHSATLMMSSLPLAAGWPQRAVGMTGVEWGLLLGVAGTSFLGQLLMTRGFQLMPASRASSVNFTQVLYSYAFGILLFHESLTPLGVLGSCLIAAGVVAVNAKPPVAPQQQQQQEEEEEEEEDQEKFPHGTASAAAAAVAGGGVSGGSNNSASGWRGWFGAKGKQQQQSYLPLAAQQRQQQQLLLLHAQESEPEWVISAQQGENEGVEELMPLQLQAGGEMELAQQQQQQQYLVANQQLLPPHAANSNSMGTSSLVQALATNSSTTSNPILGLQQQQYEER